MVNVRWVDESPEKWEECYDEIKKDYVDRVISTEEIMEKYDLTSHRWAELSKRIRNETGFIRKKGTKYGNRRARCYAFAKYYIFRRGRWEVYKCLDGKTMYFGVYSSEGEARLVVEKLKEVNWDKAQLGKIQEEVALMMEEC